MKNKQDWLKGIIDKALNNNCIHVDDETGYGWVKIKVKKDLVTSIRQELLKRVGVEEIVEIINKNIIWRDPEIMKEDMNNVWSVELLASAIFKLIEGRVE